MDSWKTLRSAGLPEGAARPSEGGPLAAEEVAAAVRALGERADALTEAERDPLAAWLAAFHHHWPDRYRAILGEAGEALRQRVRPTDPNRYLKLRRIAVENLAGRL